MINSLTNSVVEFGFTLISTIMKILLAPIDNIIMRLIPDVSLMLEKLSDFLTLCFRFMGWVIDAIGFPAGAISLIISYFVLKYTIHMSVLLFKIVIGWVKALL